MKKNPLPHVSNVTANVTADQIKEFEKAAAQGDADAQFNLGICYAHGRGVEQNRVKAAEYYRQAAEKGHVIAQYNLGTCYYLNDRGVDRNLAKAAEYFRQAADQGYADAQYNLAVCYITGQGVKPDAEEAVKYYRKAVAQGHAEAQFNLGNLYANGSFGIRQDLEEASRLFFACYAKRSEAQKKQIEAFFGANFPHQLLELKKLENPIQFIRDRINNSDTPLLSRAYECMALLKDERISDKISDEILKNEEVADLVGAIFYDAAVKLHSSKIAFESDQHAMIPFFAAVPKTSIFFPFALDFLAEIKMAMYGDDWQLAWEKGGVREIRQQIREFTSRYCYYASQPDSHGNVALKFFVSTKTALSEQGQKLLSERKLNLQESHDCNLTFMRSTLAKLPEQPSSRAMEEEQNDTERPTKKRKTEVSDSEESSNSSNDDTGSRFEAF